MLSDHEIRRITAVDETVLKKDGKNFITVYKLDSNEGDLVELTRESTKDYKRLLMAYPSLMRHAKKRATKLWQIKP